MDVSVKKTTRKEVERIKEVKAKKKISIIINHLLALILLTTATIGLIAVGKTFNYIFSLI